MTQHTTIPIRKTTRPAYDLARGDYKNDQFINLLLRVWNNLSPVDRVRVMSGENYRETTNVSPDWSAT